MGNLRTRLRATLGGALALAATLGAPRGALAQVVQDCDPSQYVDRTAPTANRTLTWNFDISTDPSRCMKIAVGQRVAWISESGGLADFETHPLGGSGGDLPNPIPFHQNGSVTFDTPGTFGFQCLSHSQMKGAIKVVAAPPPPSVPALPFAWIVAGLCALLLASGWIVRRGQRAGGPTEHA